METLRKFIFRNRHSVMATTLLVYVLVLVIEGALTGREARVIDLENPFFDLNIRDFEEFRDRQNREDRDR
jgi:hypothetical protein